MATDDKPASTGPKFALIWFPDGAWPGLQEFADALGRSKTLAGEPLASTSDAIRYAATAEHPDRKQPWIKAHFASSPREFVIIGPSDIKAAAAKPGKHWTEYA